MRALLGVVKQTGKNAGAAANRQIPAPEAALQAFARCIPLFGASPYKYFS